VSRSDETRPRLSEVVGIFQQRMPAAALGQHVDRVWINELRGPTAIDVVPDGCIDIYWTGGGLQIAGPNTEVVTLAMPCAAKLAGVRFHPGVAGRWLGVSATELVNRHQSLGDVWNRRAVDELSDRLAHTGGAAAAAAVLEQALIARLPEVAPADPIVEAAVAAMIRAGSTTRSVVGELIADFGWSERTLRRHSHEAFGYGPKTLDRILRFQRFLRLLPTVRAPLAVLASEAGYADQAHLAREVRRLSGQNPGGLMAELRA
jgi:AraC-like DNA-binding protein